MVVIRLSRSGAKKRPFYHVVAKTKRSRRDGGCIERLGYFNPVANGGEVRLQLDLDRVNYWKGVGAQPSDRVAHLIKEFTSSGVRTGAQYNEVRPVRTKKVETTNATEEAASTEETATDAE